MPRGNPNIAEYSLRAGTRFPVNRKDHTQKHPHGYLTPILKRILRRKKFRFEDPDTQKIIQIAGIEAIPIVYIWQALQGNVRAIEGIFDRMDGKVPLKLEANTPLFGIVNINLQQLQEKSEDEIIETFRKFISD